MRILLLILMLARAAAAAEIVIESPPSRVHLIELFTSEGCSSCPPADAWMRGLKGERGLWREFVPIAFHVNYRDHLGWADRLASPLFTQRQRDYGTLWRSKSIYTPEFVLDGREWNGREVPRASGEKAGVLRIRVTEGRAGIRFPPDGLSGRKIVAHLVWLAGEVENNIQAGENRGRKLQHDFVALSLESQPLTGGTATFTITRPASAKAVAAWITEADKLLQAAGGTLETR